MPIRIFHTADVHIGLKFLRGYPDAVRDKLTDARLETLDRLVHVANQQTCDLFVVAGDLFENIQVSKAQIRQAAGALSRFERLVVVLPGNHDYIQEADDPIWTTFQDALGERNLILRHARPYHLAEFNLNATIYPGVCTARHSAQNAISWIHGIEKHDNQGLRIGVAHGSLEGLSPDFNHDYYPMNRAELESSAMHVWLLGHTHVRYPSRDSGSGDRIFFPSVPEPDGFDCHHGGYACVIDLEDDGAVRYRSVQTGKYRFRELTAQVAGEHDIAQLKGTFATLDSERDLVKLTLTGRLPGEIYDARGTLIAELEKHVLHFEQDLSGLLREIRQADIDAEFTEGSFPHRLLSQLTGDEADSLALQMAHELVQEARS